VFGPDVKVKFQANLKGKKITVIENAPLEDFIRAFTALFM
jgi:translation initiation factor 1 (eIF-1/SUI1)